MQLPLFLPASTWGPPRISELPDWNNAKRVAIDIETYDPTLKTLGPGVRRGSYITGVSFALEDANRGYYLPLRHQGGDNMEEPERAIAWLREQAKNFTGEVIGANLSYDLDFLLHAGIHFPQVKMFRDVQVYEALIDELQMSYSLETICQKYLGTGKNEGALREAAATYGVNPKSGMHLLPARFVGEYAEADATLPLKVLRRQEREVEAQELERIVELESKLLPVLVRMRQRGVRVDQDKLTKVEQWSVDQEKIALEEVYRLTGVRVLVNSVWQATALVPALQSIGCAIPLTPKTKKPSIDKAFLASINHPVATAINRARRVNKVRTTFVDSIRNHMTDGRIHCTYSQTRSSTEDDEDGEGQGARYGRLACSNPNMQQAPARDPEIGPLWRSIFVPEPGELWCSSDFSSQEPRWAVHYASTTYLGKIKVRGQDGLETRVDADKSAQIMKEKYCSDPTTDPHQQLANIIMGRTATKEERSMAKTIFLGLSYGMGGSKLCHSLLYPTVMAVYDPASRRAISAESPEGKKLKEQGKRVFEAAGEEGQKLLDRFDESVPFVKALNRVCSNAANKTGYVRTMAGRKCRFPKDKDGNYEFTHKSLNRIVQGSSADQVKQALVALDENKFFMVATIHDEICCSVKNEQEGKKIAEIMENVYKLSVPSKCDIEIGISWGEAK